MSQISSIHPNDAVSPLCFVSPPPGFSNVPLFFLDENKDNFESDNDDKTTLNQAMHTFESSLSQADLKSLLLD